MWGDTWYITVAIVLGFLIGIRELFTKKQQVARDIALPEDEGIGVLESTIPPPLKIQKVSLKIRKEEDEIVAPEEYTPDVVKGLIEKKAEDKLELTKKIIVADAAIDSLEGDLILVTLKRKECVELISVIHSYQSRMGLPTDETLSGGLDVMDSDELIHRLTELTDILENLKNDFAEKKKADIEQEREDADRERDQRMLENLNNEVEDLRLRASNSESVKEIRQIIANAETVEELESIEINAESQCAQKSLTLYKEERLRRLRIESEFEKMQETIPEIDSLEQVCTIDLSMFTPKMVEQLEEIIQVRKNELIKERLEELEAQRFTELNEMISEAKTVEELESIVFEGVNESSAQILGSMVLKKANKLRYEAAMVEIHFAETPLEIDSVEIPDVGEKYAAKLERAKRKRRQLLVEQIRVKEQEKSYKKIKRLLKSTTDVHELREINFYNVSIEQFEALEELRTKILDRLQKDKFNQIKEAISTATSVSEIEEIEISGLNTEQGEELRELYDEAHSRLQFEEDLKVGIENASQNYVENRVPFSMDLESEFLQRIETNEGRSRSVQLSLSWDNKNDLDLVVRCPDGSLIYSDNDSPCGGSVDLEMNSEELSKKPLEHVIWDGFSTPEGTYEMFVMHRKRNAMADSTRFTVRVSDGPDLSYFESTVNEDQRVSLAARFNLNSDEVRNERITNDDQEFRRLRSEINSAGNASELPDIEGKIHSMYWGAKITEEFEIRKEYLIELAEKQLKDQQTQRAIELDRTINSASTVEELDAVVIDGVEDNVASRLERLIERRKTAVEKSEARQLKKKVQDNYRTLLSIINSAQSREDLEGLPELELSTKDAARIQGIFESKVQSILQVEGQAQQDANAQFLRDAIGKAETLDELSEIKIVNVSDKDGRELKNEIEDKFKQLQDQKEEEERAATIDKRVRNMLRAAVKAGRVETVSGSDREDEVVQRIEMVGAHEGEMSISLIWDNLNDLDLLVVDPNDEVIYSSKRASSTGGVMDIDMNSKPQSKRPIENIFWQVTPPEGNYHVFVHHYKKHIRMFDNDPTEYNIRIQINGEEQKFLQSSGSISNGDSAHYAATFAYP